MVRGISALLLAALVVGVFSVNAADAPVKGYWVYLGTYTGGKEGSKGIYKCVLDVTTGKLSAPELVAETTNPSFLVVSPDRKFLYAAGEVSDFGGSKNVGAVTAFAIEPKTGKLKMLNAQPSGGAGPCHVNIDKTGRTVVVANYTGGSCASLPVQADGKLGEPASVMQHKGTSVDKDRQEGPHAHSINIDPSNKFAVCADLGLDQVLIYKLDPVKGTLTPHEPPFVATAPGSGPRHFAFHPTKPMAFVINEMKCTLNSLKFDKEKGTFTIIDTASTLPREVGKGDSTAEVVVHPNGKWVYGSNRGHNSIVAFEVNDEGKLKLIGHQGEGIKTPRNFNIDPTGQWLLVGNQSGGSVSVFKINQATGALEKTDNSATLGSPVCIKFVVPVE
jgi:6-phosphogluconolactonase